MSPPDRVQDRPAANAPRTCFKTADRPSSDTALPPASRQKRHAGRTTRSSTRFPASTPLPSPKRCLPAKFVSSSNSASRQAPTPTSPVSEASAPTLHRREKARLCLPEARCCTNRVGDLAREIVGKTPAFEPNHAANGAPGDQRVTRTFRCDTVSRHWCPNACEAVSVEISTIHTSVSRTPRQSNEKAKQPWKNPC